MFGIGTTDGKFSMLVQCEDAEDKSTLLNLIKTAQKAAPTTNIQSGLVGAKSIVSKY